MATYFIAETLLLPSFILTINVINYYYSEPTQLDQLTDKESEYSGVAFSIDIYNIRPATKTLQMEVAAFRLHGTGSGRVD